MLLCHFKFSFKEDELNFRFIGTLMAWKEITFRISYYFYAGSAIVDKKTFVPLCLFLIIG